MAWGAPGIALFGSPNKQYRKGDTDIFKNPKIIELSKIFLDSIERESIRHPIGHLLESLRSHWLKLKCFSSPTPSHSWWLAAKQTAVFIKLTTHCSVLGTPDEKGFMYRLASIYINLCFFVCMKSVWHVWFHSLFVFTFSNKSFDMIF